MYLEWEPPQRLLGASETRLREQREGGGDGASRVHLALASGNTHGVAHDDWRRTSFFFFFFFLRGGTLGPRGARNAWGRSGTRTEQRSGSLAVWSRTLDRPRSPGDSLCRLYVPILTCNATHRRAHVWRLGAVPPYRFFPKPAHAAGGIPLPIPTYRTPRQGRGGIGAAYLTRPASNSGHPLFSCLWIYAFSSLPPPPRCFHSPPVPSPKKLCLPKERGGGGGGVAVASSPS